jgi:hypothetical protein
VGYIQLVEFDSRHPAQEIRQALDDWLAAVRGKRTLQMAIIAADHERPNHYWELLEFPSGEEEGQQTQRAGGDEGRLRSVGEPARWRAGVP